MKILRHDQANFDRQVAKKFSRRAVPSDAVRDLVADVIAQVEKGGDRAILSLTKKFDKASLTAKSMAVSNKELRATRRSVSKETKTAVAASRENVTAFAEKSLRRDWKMKNAQGAEVGSTLR